MYVSTGALPHIIFTRFHRILRAEQIYLREVYGVVRRGCFKRPNFLVIFFNLKQLRAKKVQPTIKKWNQFWFSNPLYHQVKGYKN
jgi:hypothetical protein